MPFEESMMKTYLAAAEEYCQFHNQDPMEMVPYPDKDGYAVNRKTTRRQVVANEMIDLAARVHFMVKHGIITIVPQ